MADAASFRDFAAARREPAGVPRHSTLVRFTHWLTAFCLFALLVSGIEIVISHPRFYWGEAGNVRTPALFQLPIPASRSAVQTGYGFVLPDQNGWSRALHFQTAWVAVFTALLYYVWGFASRHFGKHLAPARADITWRSFQRAFVRRAETWSYNVIQRVTYLFTIFVVAPLMVWTGLAMSPAFVSAVPATAALLGGQQSARTIHFFGTVFLLGFVIVHVAMVWRAGFKDRTAAMITGRVRSGEDL